VNIMDLYPGAKTCVGCGACCRKAACAVAVRVHGPVDSCPSLIYRNKRYHCALCELPGALGERYREELSVGAGCCMSMFNSDRENIPPPAEPMPEKVMERQCRVLLRHLSRQFISGDAFWLAINAASQDLGEQWKEEALRAVGEERPRMNKDFMG
jgi:hypothetical protein